MNIDDQLQATIPGARRLLVLAGLATLVACGQGQNYSSNPNYVTVGGTVANLTGTLGLNNSSADPLTITGTGAASQPFTFALSIASGATYSVAITAQPAGQVCTLSNASGTTTSNVTNIGINCVNEYTIGGTVTGLTGSVVLQNNGAEKLTVQGTGPASSTPFTFHTPVVSGGAYDVKVLTQPTGQTCTVTGGASTASANVTGIAVACQGFTLRPLPMVFTLGKSVNYSPYRTTGPGSEVPTDVQIIQDLKLLENAGFKLLRLFGADAVTTNILKLAAANTPTLSFHAGIYLEGAPATCVDTVNQTEIATGIMQANTYSNVVSISVGNETSFAKNLPITCLASYVKQVRDAVKQPVTAEDDNSFYNGSDANINYAPDTVLQNIDFVAVHIYPYSDIGPWDWQQIGVPAGPARAAAMMNASLVQAKALYARVVNYPYKTSTGVSTTIGASLPITVGETGWKATPFNSTSPIALVTNPAIANPVNAKWYLDLLGTWTGTGAPTTIFYFEAFDEPWKQSFFDDGWGLWDVSRTARYALCGFPGQSACLSSVYTGAGYYH